MLDPQITRQGDDRIVVQLPGVEDPNRIKELIGKTAKMTFRLVDDNANLTGPPPPGVDFLPMQDQPTVKVPVRRRVEVDGADLTDARPGQDQQSGAMGGELHLQQRRRAPLRRRQHRTMSASASPSCWTTR